MQCLAKLNGALRNGQDSTWTPTILIYRIVPEAEPKVYGAQTGGFGFDTEALALSAGARAVDVFNVQGQFPNMCRAY